MKNELKIVKPMKVIEKVANKTLKYLIVDWPRAAYTGKATLCDEETGNPRLTIDYKFTSSGDNRNIVEVLSFEHIECRDSKEIDELIEELAQPKEEYKPFTKEDLEKGIDDNPFAGMPEAVEEAKKEMNENVAFKNAVENAPTMNAGFASAPKKSFKPRKKKVVND